MDGWRLDVPEDLEDPDFWREFRRRIRAIDPEAYILAEIWFPKAEVLRGDQYDATMNYPFLTAVVSFAAGAHLDLAVAAQHGWLGAAVRPLDGPGFAALLGPLMTELDPDVVAVQYNLLGSHDTPRLLTIVGGDAASVRLAALVQATLPGAPAVYYGDEIGMTGSIDPAARAAFPWDRPETWDDSIRASLRAVFALRHEQPVLRDGSFRVAGAQGSMVAWVRALDGVVALVVLNNGDAPATLAVEAPELAGRPLQAVPLPGDDAPAAFVPASAAFDVSLPARTGRVFLGLGRRCRSSRRTGSGTRCSTRCSPTDSRAAGASRRPARSRTGTRRRRSTASRAATCTASRTGSTTSPTSGSRRSTSPRCSRRPRTTATTRTTTSGSTRCWAATRRCESCSTRRTRAGMRVILDGVFNHASRGFWAFNHILECGLASPYLDWFRVDREALAQGRPLRAYPDESLRHAAGGDGGPEGFGTETSFSLGYEAWWNMPALPKLNTDNPQVREYLMRVAEHWIRFGADGWRLDVAAEIDDDEFWREFRRRVKGVNPEAYIVAEVWNEDHRWLQGDQFDAYMNYPLAFAILSFAAGDHRDESAIDAHMDVRAGIRHDDGWGFLDRVEHQLRTYDPDVIAVQLNLLGSHDTARIRTICGDDLAAVRLATLAQLTLPGAPCIYYGDEIGMAGGHDPAVARRVPGRPGRRRPGAAGLRARPRSGSGTTTPPCGAAWFAPVAADGMAAAYRRGDDDEAFVVCLNAGEGPATLDAPRCPDLDGRTLATGRAGRLAVARGRARSRWSTAGSRSTCRPAAPASCASPASAEGPPATLETPRMGGPMSPERQDDPAEPRRILGNRV